ncbi:MAG: DinB family protein [Pseudomonadota bacterium]
MARYNHCQNRQLYALADQLPDTARRRELGMCFGSVHNLFNHMLWDDMTLMHCLADGPRPEVSTVRTSVFMETGWAALKSRHDKFAQRICEWADGVDTEWLSGVALWRSAAAQESALRSRAMLVMQLFNHQTHHRGQLHVMLSQLGVATPHTDVCFISTADNTKNTTSVDYKSQQSVR